MVKPPVHFNLRRSKLSRTVSGSLLRSVDIVAPAAHRRLVSKKPQKVADPASPYAAKKPAKPAVKDADAEFQRITGKLFKERKELLHKLAQ